MRFKSIVILTGAGISAESGLATFRASAGSNTGLWENHPVEQVATAEGYAANPELVQRFYNARRAALSSVTPNPAHSALAKLEGYMSARGSSFLLVTQNVDDLHERGGSQNLLHMHGELKRAFCTSCDANIEQLSDLSEQSQCPSCARRSSLRPDIVWFGEMPYYMDAIETALSVCDLFVSIGTSGAVYPAAGFVKLAKRYGAKTLELNLEPSAGSAYFHETRFGKASEIVPAWVDEFINA